MLKLVTIIGKNHSAGLEKDKIILSQLLKENNTASEFRDVFNYIPLNKESELSIHLEVVEERYFGVKNILIPNQEWFFKKWLKQLVRFDAILCKSWYSYNIFKRYHKNVIFVGFTSLDCYSAEEKKLECFHASGFSRAKGTQFILDAWAKGMPPLHVISPHQLIVPSIKNLFFYNSVLDELEYNQLRNQSLIHIYPSQVEGFGHCINEAKSCGAVVITSDYSPMNELVTNFLLPPSSIFKIPGRLGQLIYIAPREISKLIKKIVHKNDLQNIGQENRKSFLANDKLFRERFIYQLNQLV